MSGSRVITNPRRLVLRDLQLNDQSDGRKRDAPAANDSTSKIPAGFISLVSNRVPALKRGQEYTITIDQTVTYKDKNGASQTVPTDNLQDFRQKFRVPGSKTSLNPSLIHSVYPPEMHTEHANCLAHVLYNNDQVPWMNPSPNTSSPANPWVGLLVFTDGELTLTDSEVRVARTAAGISAAVPWTSTATKTYPIPNVAFQTFVKNTTTDDPFTGDSPSVTELATQMQLLVIRVGLYKAIFTNPDQYQAFNHVRNINTVGMANLDGDEAGVYAVTISRRTGLLNCRTATKMHAHLVAIPPNSTNVKASSTLCGVASLYSWSWMCVPQEGLTAEFDFQTLGKSIQPLRYPDVSINAATKGLQQWIQHRMLTGYTLGSWIPASGEKTTCVYRTPLVPIDHPRPSLPASNTGLDLAILDTEKNLWDLTYPIAWELGKLLMIADPLVSAALLRIRGNVSKTALQKSKRDLDAASSAKVFVKGEDALTTVKGRLGDITAIAKTGGATASLTKTRWIRAPTATGTRAAYTFLNDTVQQQYSRNVPTAVDGVAASTDVDTSSGRLRTQPANPFNELNDPADSDYATLLTWILNANYFSGIPWSNLIADPSYLPRESIRTFYVDPIWYEVFLDGALSVGQHMSSTDYIRPYIKAAINTYKNTEINGHLPQFPTWGFFVRSELVQKFPDMKVLAPRGNNDMPSSGADVLQLSRVGDDVLLVLFDRKPGANPSLFPDGITLQPPEHQMSFALGDMNDYTQDSTSWDITSVTLKYRAMQTKDGVNHTVVSSNPSATCNKAGGGTSVPFFDFANNLVNATPLMDAAKLGLTPTFPPGLFESGFVGAQLIGAQPKLLIPDRAGGAAVAAAKSRAAFPISVKQAMPASTTDQPSSVKQLSALPTLQGSSIGGSPFALQNAAIRATNPLGSLGESLFSSSIFHPPVIPKPTPPAADPPVVLAPAPVVTASPLNLNDPNVFLAALANTDVTDKGFIKRFLIDGKPSPDLSQSNVGSANAAPPQLTVGIYNLCGYLTDDYTLDQTPRWPRLYSTGDSGPNFATINRKVYVSAMCRTKMDSLCTGVVFQFKCGVMYGWSGCTFKPLPLNATAATAGKTPTTTNMDYTAVGSAGLTLPTVRATAPTPRWTPTVSFVPAADMTVGNPPPGSLNGYLYVTMKPTDGGANGIYDIAANNDMGFVIEGMELNWAYPASNWRPPVTWQSSFNWVENYTFYDNQLKNYTDKSPKGSAAVYCYAANLANRNAIL